MEKEFRIYRFRLRKLGGLFFVLLLIAFLTGCSGLFTDVEIMIINNTTDACTGFFTKTPDSIDWGTDLLSADIDISNSVTLLIPKGIYDLMATYANSEASILTGVDFTSIDIYELSLQEAAQ